MGNERARGPSATSSASEQVYPARFCQPQAAGVLGRDAWKRWQRWRWGRGGVRKNEFHFLDVRASSLSLSLSLSVPRGKKYIYGARCQSMASTGCADTFVECCGRHLMRLRAHTHAHARTHTHTHSLSFFLSTHASAPSGDRQHYSTEGSEGWGSAAARSGWVRGDGDHGERERGGGGEMCKPVA
jgi:hypothetical protein